jgi:hypothetical protein
LADELGGQPEERLRALDSRGVARGDLGDLSGMDDLRAALETCQEAIEFTERRGLGEGTAWIRSATLVPLLDLGRWDEAVDTANALIAWERDHGGQYLSEMAHQVKARVLLWRGEVDAARVLAQELLPRARAIDDLQLLMPALTVAAAVEQAVGQHTSARALVEEVQGWSPTGAGAAGTWATTSPSSYASAWPSASAPPPRRSPRRPTTACLASNMDC